MSRLLLATVALLAAACTRNSLSVSLSDASVELDAFSGLPNPRWQLSPDERSDLEGQLNGLPKTSPIEIPSQLGYRGFTIIDENNQRLTVTNNGYVVLHETNGDRFYRDTKDVQSWLKRQAESRGFGNLVTRP